jgi:hypothetical protein
VNAKRIGNIVWLVVVLYLLGLAIVLLAGWITSA